MDFDALEDHLKQEFRDFSSDTMDRAEDILAYYNDGEVAGDLALQELRSLATNLKGAGKSYDFTLFAIVSHRMEDYLREVEVLDKPTAKSLQVFIDRLRDVADNAGGKIDAGAIVRSLPARAHFDVKDIEVLEIEILLISPPGTAERIIARELTQCGYRVVHVVSPFEGMQMALTTRPDLVMVTAVHAQLTGVDVACALQAMPAGRGIPVALVTSLEDKNATLKDLPKTVPIIHKGKQFGDDVAKALTELGIT